LIRDSYIFSQSTAGPSFTFNGFGNIGREDRIDYIFVSRELVVSSHQTMKLKRDKLFISDHWPVMAEFRIPKLKP